MNYVINDAVSHVMSHAVYQSDARVVSGLG